MRNAIILFVALVAASALAQIQDAYKLEARGESQGAASHQAGRACLSIRGALTDLSTHTVIWQPHLVGDDSRMASTTEKDGLRYELTVLLYADLAAADFRAADFIIFDRQGVIVDSLRARWRGPSHALEMNASGAYEVGHNVKAPQVIKRVEAAYPLEARMKGVKGLVVLQVLIDKTGAVRQIVVRKEFASGLSEAAVDAVRQWQFAPATLDGKPVDVVLNLTINFRLK